MEAVTIFYVLLDQGCVDEPVVNLFTTEEDATSFISAYESRWEHSVHEIETFIGSKTHTKAVENTLYEARIAEL